MNKLLSLIIIALFLSCSNSPKTSEEKDSKNKNTDEFEMVHSNDSAMVSQNNVITEDQLEEEEPDCIFDQSTQTDDFLNDIKEFKNYTWDSISKTATIILANEDTLFVSRGGCDNFGVSAELWLLNDTIDYSIWDNVNIQILWIANMLQSQFAYNDIKTEIDSSKQVIENDYGYFSNEYLQDNNYEFTRQIEENLTIITLSYYIN